MRTRPVNRKSALSIAALTLVFVSSAVLVRPRNAPAQQPPAAAAAEQMRQMQEVMGPMMRANMQAMMEAALAVLARKESADQMATFSKNYLDALIAKGFTRDEALRLVAAHAPTLVPGIR